MQILYSRCCGIDVHKDSVTVCVPVYSDLAEPDIRKKELATYYKALLKLKMWLLAQKSNAGGTGLHQGSLEAGMGSADWTL